MDLLPKKKENIFFKKLFFCCFFEIIKIMIKEIEFELKKLGNEKRSEKTMSFFKTGKGEYGEGDIFIGVSVPEQRQIAKKFINISLLDLENLLQSSIHEFRLTGFFILTYKYEKANDEQKKEIYLLYLKNISFVNNWDIVDTTAPKVIGEYLFEFPDFRDILYKFAKSKNLWKRRIAILSTFTFIKNNDFNDALKISEILLADKHDLIHKAVGWMLREIGKRDLEMEKKFLDKWCLVMPRTMLRYSIEKFSVDMKKYYMKKK